MAQRISTEQSDAEKCEIKNSNSDVSSSSNSLKINTITDLSASNKNVNTESVDARIQQQEVTQLHNASKIADVEPEIKPLTDITIKLEDIKPGSYIRITFLIRHFPHAFNNSKNLINQSTLCRREPTSNGA